MLNKANPLFSPSVRLFVILAGSHIVSISFKRVTIPRISVAQPFRRDSFSLVGGLDGSTYVGIAPRGH